MLKMPDVVPKTFKTTLPILCLLASLTCDAGPLLVRHGIIHPAFRAEAESRKIRNGVGVSGATAIFAISERLVNFYEFAAFFRDTLHCPDALYLDGVVSGLYSAALGRDDAGYDLGPMVGVVQ